MAAEARMVRRRFADLAIDIRATTPALGNVRLVAIDGPGGAGKSVFAERLATALGGAPVVRTDDFASWEQPLDWWPDLETNLLSPLADGETATYRAYDWTLRRPDGWRRVPPAEVVVLEGVSSSRLAIADRLSFAIWIETPRAIRLARGLQRDGEAMRGQWLAWMAEEDAHFEVDRARDRADVIVDGARSVTGDSETTFVVLGEPAS